MILIYAVLGSNGLEKEEKEKEKKRNGWKTFIFT